MHTTHPLGPMKWLSFVALSTAFATTTLPPFDTSELLEREIDELFELLQDQSADLMAQTGAVITTAMPGEFLAVPQRVAYGESKRSRPFEWVRFDESSESETGQDDSDSSDESDRPDKKRLRSEEITWQLLARKVCRDPFARPESEVAGKLPWPDASEPAWPDKLKPRFKEFVVRQAREDVRNRLFAPSLLEVTSDCEQTEVGKLCFDVEPVATTETSTIHGVRGNNSLVVKYQMDGFEEDRMVHPLLIDFWFLQHVAPLGISPQPIAISPPSGMVHHRSIKCNFAATRKELLQCLDDRPIIRYGVMQRVGPSLHDFMSSHPQRRMPLRNALLMGVKIIQVIRTLHESAGVVHGDIHSGNVCMRDSETASEVVLIDYGRAFFIADHFAGDELVRAPGSWNHALFTPWEIEGLFPGRRDDIFRAMMLVSSLMNGPDFHRWLTRLESDVEQSRTVKNGNIFFALPGFSSLDGVRIPPAMRVKVVRRLGDALNLVRATSISTGRPDYEGIIAHFEAAISLLPEVSVTTVTDKYTQTE